MQPGAGTQQFHLGKLLLGRMFQPFDHMRRKGERAAVGEFDHHAPDLVVVACSQSPRFLLAGGKATLEGGVHLGVSQFGHERL